MVEPITGGIVGDGEVAVDGHHLQPLDCVARLGLVRSASSAAVAGPSASASSQPKRSPRYRLKDSVVPERR